MSKRSELIERRRAQDRRQTLIVLGIIVVAALVLIGGAVFLTNKPAPAFTAVASTRPTPVSAQKDERAWGPADAPIKVEEYLDYQCPACGAYNRSFEEGVYTAFAGTGKVRYEVHSMSFIGQESIDAAQAAMCANDQNLFWQMHNTLFASQNGENQGTFTKAHLKDIAAAISGMDTAAFNTCLDSDKYANQVTQERDDGDKRGVNQTPTFFVNGKMYVGTQSADDFRKIFTEVAPDVKF